MRSFHPQSVRTAVIADRAFCEGSNCCDVNSGDVLSDRADWRAVLICKKYILIIIILAVVFLSQCFVYASDTEITDKIEQQMLEKIDMSDIQRIICRTDYRFRI